jgi:hypothetical protein
MYFFLPCYFIIFYSNQISSKTTRGVSQNNPKYQDIPDYVLKIEQRFFCFYFSYNYFFLINKGHAMNPWLNNK